MKFLERDINKEKGVVTFLAEFTQEEFLKMVNNGSGIVGNRVVSCLAEEFIEKYREEIISKIDLDDLAKKIENYVKLEIMKKELGMRDN